MTCDENCICHNCLPGSENAKRSAKPPHPFHADIRSKYTNIVETGISKYGTKQFRVDLVVNHQRFTTCHNRDEESAKWYQEQLTKALCYMIQEQQNNQAS